MKRKFHKCILSFTLAEVKKKVGKSKFLKFLRIYTYNCVLINLNDTVRSILSFTLAALGLKPNEIFQELRTAKRSKAPSLTTVKRWYARFSRGKNNLGDLHRSGAPITECTSANIQTVKGLIKTIPNITYDEIEAETNLSRGTIQKIISEKLKMKKLTSRWIPHDFTSAQKK